ncbi:MAG: hypothetical protein GX197_03760 [Firmicutes bacterium]|nr:hypothetical protein [Bacillota bacterium]
MSKAYKLDVRGLSCPEPVIRVKKALETNKGGLTVLADSFVAAENIRRLVGTLGYQCKTDTNADDEFVLTITKEV